VVSPICLLAGEVESDVDIEHGDAGIVVTLADRELTPLNASDFIKTGDVTPCGVLLCQIRSFTFGRGVTLLHSI
jgi:hypothetical protein